jgi:hypothetical protein
VSIAIALGVVLLVLWVLVLRRRPVIGFYVTCGAALAWIGAAFVPPISLSTMPVWLPALPLALIATALFFFGALAWYWGSDR